MVFYACSEMKSLSESEPYHPQNLDETRGVPLRVYVKDGFCIVAFVWGMVAFPEELRDELEGLVSRKCAILRLDGKYHVRDLEAEDATR